MKRKNLPELFKQDTAKRDTIVLGSVVIKIKHGGFEVFCDNASEAAELLRQLGEQSAAGKTPWVGIRFSSFIEALGEKQRDVLKLLLAEKRVSDEWLRAYCEIASNQQLAGILSGISKQAAARDIPARAVFGIENEYSGGKAAKYFVAAPEFLRAAADNNWPDAEVGSDEINAAP